MGLILVVLLAVLAATVLATTVLATTVLAARNGLVVDETAQELTERVARQRAPMSEPYSGRQTAH